MIFYTNKSIKVERNSNITEVTKKEESFIYNSR
uniref:Uncharacterized protein n=1 Tax=Arundo donax TaxID=35708 RepID=A0A0A9FLC3_ARUDO